MRLQRKKVALAAARGGVSVAGVAEVIQTRVPAQLLNNAAVLYMRAGRPEKALQLLEEALQVRLQPEGRSCPVCPNRPTEVSASSRLRTEAMSCIAACNTCSLPCGSRDLPMTQTRPAQRS